MNTTTEPTGKRCATGILLILLSLATVVFLKACGVIHAAPPRIDLIKVGMTVAEVDGALGKPESVMDMPDLPAEHRYDLNLADIAEVWRRGSVVSSWLLDLTAMALAENPTLSEYTGFVQDSGEGRWTIQAAIDEAVPVDVLSAALYTRFRSRQEHTFAEKMLSAMRQKFGGHVELTAAAKPKP